MIDKASSSEPFLGILQLDTRFPRVEGDVGNVDSYPFPARIRVVQQADVPAIVNDKAPDESLRNAFIQAARALEADGAFAIISTCGFLVSLQSEIAAAVSIPVRLSALSDFHRMHHQYHASPVGIITASAEDLTARLLALAGIPEEIVEIAGMEDCHAFASAILLTKHAQTESLDQAAIARACVNKAQELLERQPQIAMFLLECGNLPPYAEAIQAATGKPVFSMLDTAKALYNTATESPFHPVG